MLRYGAFGGSALRIVLLGACFFAGLGVATARATQYTIVANELLGGASGGQSEPVNTSVSVSQLVGASCETVPDPAPLYVEKFDNATSAENPTVGFWHQQLGLGQGSYEWYLWRVVQCGLQIPEPLPGGPDVTVTPEQLVNGNPTAEADDTLTWAQMTTAGDWIDPSPATGYMQDALPLIDAASEADSSETEAGAGEDPANLLYLQPPSDAEPNNEDYTLQSDEDGNPPDKIYIQVIAPGDELTVTPQVDNVSDHEISFSATVTDPDGNVIPSDSTDLTWKWDFGDNVGTSDADGGTYDYGTECCNFDVTVTVTDSQLQSGEGYGSHPVSLEALPGSTQPNSGNGGSTTAANPVGVVGGDGDAPSAPATQTTPLDTAPSAQPVPVHKKKPVRKKKPVHKTLAVKPGKPKQSVVPVQKTVPSHKKPVHKKPVHTQPVHKKRRPSVSLASPVDEDANGSGGGPTSGADTGTGSGAGGGRTHGATPGTRQAAIEAGGATSRKTSAHSPAPHTQVSTVPALSSNSDNPTSAKRRSLTGVLIGAVPLSASSSGSPTDRPGQDKAGQPAARRPADTPFTVPAGVIAGLLVVILVGGGLAREVLTGRRPRARRSSRRRPAPQG